MHGHIELPATVILDRQILPLVSIQIALHEADEAAYAVIDMDNVIAGLQIRIEGLRRLGRESLPCRGAGVPSRRSQNP